MLSIAGRRSGRAQLGIKLTLCVVPSVSVAVSTQPLKVVLMIIASLGAAL